MRNPMIIRISDYISHGHGNDLRRENSGLNPLSEAILPEEQEIKYVDPIDDSTSSSSDGRIVTKHEIYVDHA